VTQTPGGWGNGGLEAGLIRPNGGSEQRGGKGKKNGGGENSHAVLFEGNFVQRGGKRNQWEGQFRAASHKKSSRGGAWGHKISTQDQVDPLVNGERGAEKKPGQVTEGKRENSFRIIESVISCGPADSS